MTRNEFNQIREDMQRAGWVMAGTYPKSGDSNEWGLRMEHGDQVFYLNKDSANSIPPVEPKIDPEHARIMNVFRKEFHWINFGELSIDKMKKFLAGDLVPVKISGTNKYEVWKKEDIESGKFDERKMEIMEHNRRIMRLRRAQKDKDIKAMKVLLEQMGLPEDMANILFR